MDDAQKAREQLKAVYDDGKATINGRDYVFLSMKHKQRRKVMAFYTRIGSSAGRKDFSFVEDPAFDAVEAIIHDHVSLDGALLSKLPDHWDTYPGDYMTFVMLAMGVISYPFLAEGGTN